VKFILRVLEPIWPFSATSALKSYGLPVSIGSDGSELHSLHDPA
jgi:hypothetical protein